MNMVLQKLVALPSLVLMVLFTATLSASEEPADKDLNLFLRRDDTLSLTSSERYPQVKISVRAAQRSGTIRDIIASQKGASPIILDQVDTKMVPRVVKALTLLDAELNRFENYAQERGEKKLSQDDNAMILLSLYNLFKQEGVVKTTPTNILVDRLTLMNMLKEPYTMKVWAKFIYDKIPEDLRQPAYALLNGTLPEEEQQEVQKKLKEILVYDLTTLEPGIKQFMKDQIAYNIAKKDETVVIPPELTKKDITAIATVFLTTGQNAPLAAISARASQRAGTIRDLIAKNGIEKAIIVDQIKAKELQQLIKILTVLDENIAFFEELAKQNSLKHLSPSDRASISRRMYKLFKEKGATDKPTKTLIAIIKKMYDIKEPYILAAYIRYIFERVPKELRSDAIALLEGTTLSEEKKQTLNDIVSFDLTTLDPHIKKIMAHHFSIRSKPALAFGEYTEQWGPQDAPWYQSQNEEDVHARESALFDNQSDKLFPML